MMKFKVLVEPDGDGFHAKALTLPGCGSWGHTVEEALVNVKEAIGLYLEPEDMSQFKGANVYEVEVAI